MQVTLKSKPSDSPREGRTGDSQARMAPAGGFQWDGALKGTTGSPSPEDKLLYPKLRNILIQVPWGFAKAKEPRSFQELNFGIVSVGQHFSSSGSLTVPITPGTKPV